MAWKVKTDEDQFSHLFLGMHDYVLIWREEGIKIEQEHAHVSGTTVCTVCWVGLKGSR